MWAMGRHELIRRYLVFFFGLTIGAFGVTLMTRAVMGVNSVACVAYVTSVFYPFTMGTVTIAWYTLMLILQCFVLTKEQRRTQYIDLILQIPSLIVFGIMVDIFMYLTEGFHPDRYGYSACLITFLISCLIIAVNIAIQAIADVAKLSGDAFCIVLAHRLGKEIGLIKLIYDLVLVFVALAITLIGSNFTKIVGVREGTILGSLLIGPLITWSTPHLNFLNKYIERGKEKDDKAAAAAKQKQL